MTATTIDDVMQRIYADNDRLKAAIAEVHPCRTQLPIDLQEAPFVFDLHGVFHWPEFQFEGDRVRSEFQRVSDALDPEMNQWQRTGWIVSSNGWLDGRAPLDVVDDLEAVLRAAEHTKDVIG